MGKEQALPVPDSKKECSGNGLPGAGAFRVAVFVSLAIERECAS